MSWLNLISPAPRHAPDETRAAVNPADIRLAAMNLLSRREHSWVNCARNCGATTEDETQVETQLQKLVGENPQSDDRYAESFARQRSQRATVLRGCDRRCGKGVGDIAIARAFESAQLDWWRWPRGRISEKIRRTGQGRHERKVPAHPFHAVSRLFPPITTSI